MSLLNRTSRASKGGQDESDSIGVIVQICCGHPAVDVNPGSVQVSTVSFTDRTSSSLAWRTVSSPTFRCTHIGFRPCPWRPKILWGRECPDPFAVDRVILDEYIEGTVLQRLQRVTVTPLEEFEKLQRSEVESYILTTELSATPWAPFFDETFDIPGQRRYPPSVGPKKGRLIPPHSIEMNFHERLHHEIKAFSCWCEPRLADLKRTSRTMARLLLVARCLWPTCKIVPYGSSVVGLALRNSDIDVGINDVPEEPAAACGRLARVLHRTCHWSACPIKYAKVPLVKYTDPSTGISVDVSINSDAAGRSTNFVRAKLAEWPMLRPLVLVLKMIMSQSDRLSDASQGGLSSYCLFVMALSYLQSTKRDPAIDMSKMKLGDHLLGFLWRYTAWDRECDAIDVRGVGCTFPKIRLRENEPCSVRRRKPPADNAASPAEASMDNQSLTASSISTSASATDNAAAYILQKRVPPFDEDGEISSLALSNYTDSAPRLVSLTKKTVLLDDRFSVSSPVEPVHDVARSCSRIEALMDLIRGTLRILLRLRRKEQGQAGIKNSRGRWKLKGLRSKSILATIIRIDDSMFEWRQDECWPTTPCTPSIEGFVSMLKSACTPQPLLDRLAALRAQSMETVGAVKPISFSLLFPANGPLEATLAIYLPEKPEAETFEDEAIRVASELGLVEEDVARGRIIPPMYNTPPVIPLNGHTWACVELVVTTLTTLDKNLSRQRCRPGGRWKSKRSTPVAKRAPAIGLTEQPGGSERRERRNSNTSMNSSASRTINSGQRWRQTSPLLMPGAEDFPPLTQDWSSAQCGRYGRNGSNSRRNDITREGKMTPLKTPHNDDETLPTRSSRKYVGNEWGALSLGGEKTNNQNSMGGGRPRKGGQATTATKDYRSSLDSTPKPRRRRRTSAVPLRPQCPAVDW